ncbi:MAG: hypothetical protein Q4C47_05700 [Planctomycetia bacterium]|nr:hypothetical protein [Planctomycetia bacterium]
MDAVPRALSGGVDEVEENSAERRGIGRSRLIHRSRRIRTVPVDVVTRVTTYIDERICLTISMEKRCGKAPEMGRLPPVRRG